jgi:hypothetical protein
VGSRIERLIEEAATIFDSSAKNEHLRPPKWPLVEYKITIHLEEMGQLSYYLEQIVQSMSMYFTVYTRAT